MPDEEVQTTEGTAGEPVAVAAPEADGSQELATEADEVIASLNKPAEDAPPHATLTLDESIAKQLEALDPRALPEGLRRKLEEPFLSRYTTKTTEWDTERKALMGVIDRLTNQQPTPEQRDQLQERLAEGDLKGAVDILRAEVRQEITPDRAYIAQVRAINEAKAIVPDLDKYEGEVAQRLAANPIALEVSKIGNHKYASQVIASIATQVKLEALTRDYAELKGSFDTKLRQAITETQKRYRNLPSSTSHVGKSPTKTPSEDKSPRQIMEEAWAAAGGS